MSDGWRGTRLGYSGGRTGFLDNYGNDLKKWPSKNNNNLGETFNYRNSIVKQKVATTMITGFGLVLGLAILTGNKGLNNAVNKIPIVGTVNKEVQKNNYVKGAQNTVKQFTP